MAADFFAALRATFFAAGGESKGESGGESEDDSGGRPAVAAVFLGAFLATGLATGLATSLAARLAAGFAVAGVGFMMLTGRMNWRYGLTVILGCFILFGAGSIVAGIRQSAGGF